MKSCQIGRASGIVMQPDAKHGVRALKLLPRLVEKKAGLRLHRSMPSARISCISGSRESL